MARRPAKVKGLKWREDRRTWEARYDINGKRVRKSFIERAEAIAWLQTARGLKHKEGLDCLPTSATQPLLTAAEKRAIREERINGLNLNDLCDQYLAHIKNPNNPESPKDLVNPPQRIEVIKATFGDRPAASIKPHEIKDWLISLGLAGAPSIDINRPSPLSIRTPRSGSLWNPIHVEMCRTSPSSLAFHDG